MHNYRKLNIWSDSMELVVQIYGISKRFPMHERYGLSSQIQRSAVSIPSNIAEGSGRKSIAEFVQYLHIASGSLNELHTQLLISVKLKYIDEINIAEHLNRIDRIQRSIIKLIDKCKAEQR